MYGLTAEAHIGLALALLTVGALICALLAKYRKVVGWVAFAFVLPACALILYVAGSVFTGNPVGPHTVFKLIGLQTGLVVRVDSLSAIFLAITSLIAFCSSMYSIRYIEIYSDESLLRYYPFFLLFIASVISVVIVADMLFFIIAWEVMTLTSYALVVFQTRERAVIRAGVRYFVATHAATACMLLGTIILYASPQGGSFHFESLAGAMEWLAKWRPGLLHLVLLLFFVGFATKAGVLPFGFWLPETYPAAPTAASALFAGTMGKLGVYGIVRIFAELLPITRFSTSWGQTIAILGTISIFIGTVTALVQSDSKRLLSFHMIGQVGYMLLGVGTGICFLRINPALATVGLMAGLFHVVNNAYYKSLLFLNAGAVLYRTGTRDLNRVGGLGTIMPLTTAMAIIASLSIAGVPPFSGFSSKWMIFSSSIIGGMQIPLPFIVLAIIAVFISAVTLASFLKFLGTAFLGRLHVEGKPDVEHADVPITMRIPQVIIAIFCILFGIWPALPAYILHLAVSGVLPADYSPALKQIAGTALIGIHLNLGEGVVSIWNPALVVTGLVLCCLIPYLIYRIAGAPVRSVAMWLCGEEHTVDEARYKAHGFYAPFNEFLSFRVGTYRVTTYFPSIPKPKAGKLAEIPRFFDFDKLYYRIIEIGARWCERFSIIHTGVPQWYVLLMAIGVGVAIVILYLLS